MGSKKDGPGRPRGFDADAALEAAMLLFWRQGYARTSVDDLVAATGASRTGLYGVFGDKRALLAQCLALYRDRFTARVDAVLAAPVDGRERMKRVLDASADRLTSDMAPPGCLRCNTTLELMGMEAELDLVLQEMNDAFTATLDRLVERAVDEGEVLAPDRRRLCIFFTAIVDGMVTLARGGASREELAQVIEVALTAWPEVAAEPETRSGVAGIDSQA